MLATLELPFRAAGKPDCVLLAFVALPPASGPGSSDGKGAKRYTVRRAVDRVYGASIGYGYRPGRVLWLLTALLILVITSLEIPAGQLNRR